MLFVMIEQASIPFTPLVLQAASFCLAIEWLSDSIRTSVNVTGDAIGAAIIDSLCAKEQQPASAASPPLVLGAAT